MARFRRGRRTRAPEGAAPPDRLIVPPAVRRYLGRFPRRQPVRVTLLLARGASARDIADALDVPYRSLREVAPGVLDARIDGNRLRTLVIEHGAMLRLVERGGAICGAPVPEGASRVSVLVPFENAADAPDASRPASDAERRAALERLGLEVKDMDELRATGTIAVSRLADLVPPVWLGPIEVAG